MQSETGELRDKEYRGDIVVSRRWFDSFANGSASAITNTAANIASTGIAERNESVECGRARPGQADSQRQN
jgi:hypothetical protein